MDLTHLLAFIPLYVVAFISLYTIIAWGLIFSSRRKLADGYIKTFTTRILLGVGLMFFLSIWLLYINVRQIQDVKIQIMNYGFLLLMITFITWVAVSIHKLANQFGFQMAADSVTEAITSEVGKKPKKKPKKVTKLK
jgi:glucan phosphoethanolaminetransferase (alkaline phosphatase superfamily)